MRHTDILGGSVDQLLLGGIGCVEGSFVHQSNVDVLYVGRCVLQDLDRLSGFVERRCRTGVADDILDDDRFHLMTLEEASPLAAPIQVNENCARPLWCV
jgi:hypothetical protein